MPRNDTRHQKAAWRVFDECQIVPVYFSLEMAYLVHSR
jgi:hypothetical protein